MGPALFAVWSLFMLWGLLALIVALSLAISLTRRAAREKARAKMTDEQVQSGRVAFLFAGCLRGALAVVWGSIWLAWYPHSVVLAATTILFVIIAGLWFYAWLRFGGGGRLRRVFRSLGRLATVPG